MTNEVGLSGDGKMRIAQPCVHDALEQVSAIGKKTVISDVFVLFTEGLPVSLAKECLDLV